MSGIAKVWQPNRPRLGFLGVGWIGRHRMQAVVESNVADAAVIVDPAKQLVEEAKKVAPESEALGSFEELLESGIDGLVIATPSALHAEQSIRALEKGIAVFCQKPLGRTEQEVRRVIDAAKANDRLLGVDLSYRFVKGVPELRKMIRAGELGDIYAVNLTFHNAYGPDKPWFYDPKLSGGGCVMDLGIHLVDLALWTLGFPAVRALTSNLQFQGRQISGRGESCEDYAAAQLQLESGAAIQLACSWKLPAGCDCVIDASFYGTKGGVALRNVNGSFYDFRVEQFSGISRNTLAAPPDLWGGRAVVDWAKRLAEGQRFDPEVEHLATVSRVLDGIYAGAVVNPEPRGSA